jgi:tRNA-Thr(GGU) m(6)t(6)A37 methyltransferase TsaA
MTTSNPSVTLQPIGVIRSRYREAAGTPIQPTYADGSEGEVIVHSPFEPALADLDGIERIWLLYWFDRAGAFRPRVVPYRDTRERGVLATRSPCRPNRIGMSVVHLVGRDHNVLRVRGLDTLDGTPLLDIKPYVPAFDAYPTSQAGWLEVSAEDRRHADARFEQRDDGSAPHNDP